LPPVDDELLAVDILQRGNNTFLQIEKIGFDGGWGRRKRSHGLAGKKTEQRIVPLRAIMEQHNHSAVIINRDV
jgi:hypothetical protein